MRSFYEDLWGKFPEYREASAADFLTPVFLQHFAKEIRPGERVIDFGCGPGRSALLLAKAGLKVELIDWASNCLDVEIFLKMMKGEFRFWEACLWDLPSNLVPAEWGICFDVFEHLPSERIDDTLLAMSQRILRGMLIAIDLQEDTFGALVGHKLHLTLKPCSWWEERLSRFFLIKEILLESEEKIVLAVGSIHKRPQ